MAETTAAKKPRASRAKPKVAVEQTGNGSSANASGGSKTPQQLEDTKFVSFMRDVGQDTITALIKQAGNEVNPQFQQRFLLIARRYSEWLGIAPTTLKPLAMVMNAGGPG